MKIRLFCFLSAIFILAGLLLPVSVYAVDTPATDVTVSVETDTTAPDSCNTNTESAAAEPVAIDEETMPADEGADQCQDDGGTYSRVSWNS